MEKENFNTSTPRQNMALLNVPSKITKFLYINFNEDFIEMNTFICSWISEKDVYSFIFCFNSVGIGYCRKLPMNL